MFRRPACNTAEGGRESVLSGIKGFHKSGRGFFGGERANETRGGAGAGGERESERDREKEGTARPAHLISNGVSTDVFKGGGARGQRTQG